MSDVRPPGGGDFDFLFGTWRVRNRRLVTILAGSDAWEAFEATATEQPLLGGLANLGQFDAPDSPRGPIHAITVRLFDERSGNWSIYWSTRGSGTFGIPTVGRFHEGVGLFYDRETFEGRPVVVRFRWTRDGAACRWEQAFSADDGATWETNWVMDFTRLA